MVLVWKNRLAFLVVKHVDYLDNVLTEDRNSTCSLLGCVFAMMIPDFSMGFNT